MQYITRSNESWDKYRWKGNWKKKKRGGGVQDCNGRQCPQSWVQLLGSWETHRGFTGRGNGGRAWACRVHSISRGEKAGLMRRCLSKVVSWNWRKGWWNQGPSQLCSVRSFVCCGRAPKSVAATSPVLLLSAVGTTQFPENLEEIKQKKN